MHPIDLDHLSQLEKTARRLEPNKAQLQRWNDAVTQFGSHFIETLPQQPTYFADGRTGKEIEQLAFQSQPRHMHEVLEILDITLTKTALNAASGKHFGYVSGGGLYTTGLGDYIAAVTNVYSGIFYAGPGAVRMENQLIQWMCVMHNKSWTLGFWHMSSRW